MSALPQSGLITRAQLKVFYILSAAFAVICMLGILKGMMFVTLLPILFLAALLFIFNLDFMVFLAVLVTPLSLNLAETSAGIGVSLPSEPMMFALFMIFWLKVMADGGLDVRIQKHPVSILIALHLGWFILTTITSTMFVVSFKSTLARLCYVSVFYYMLLYLFSNYKNIYKFLWYYMIPLLVVVVYTITRHAASGFSQEIAHIAMTPFYNDHTAYAAALCFFIPPLFAMATDTTRTRNYRIFSMIVLAILIIATVLSYTRAAWVGLVIALGAYLVFVLRVRSALIYTSALLVILLAFMFRTQITMKLESNQKVSSTDYASHVESIGNISSDDSNIERLNRWACALRMWAEKPILGFGPGTYMFKYAPYQKFSERSAISTNFGTVGGSHSEYLGPLSEQGFMGPIWFILIAIAVFQRTSALLKRTTNRQVKALARGLLLGLVTYWVHGSMNFFLDTEKASVPFWGFIAALVALDIYHSNKSEETSETTTAE